jgi:UDP-4-amino-4,6-dideoxy-N-acetyl-beta-L-altrosamine transaminase
MSLQGTDLKAGQGTAHRSALAINGGKPVRNTWLAYGKQSINEADVEAVVKALKSDWLTQGPAIAEFEQKAARLTGAKHAVAFSNCTAALHGSYFACGIGSGDEIITSPITFVATANAALYLGAHVKFADVEPTTGNISVESVRKLISKKTKAITGIDFTGQPCDIDELRQIAKENKIFFVEDAAHAIGAKYKGQPIGSLADCTNFSFHPVKTITTGEGGMVTTNDDSLAHKLKLFRSHGIERESAKLENESHGPWYYEMQELGYNYRITDIQAALGSSQLDRLPMFIERRREIARQYRAAFADIAGIRCLEEKPFVESAYHLFCILLDDSQHGKRRRQFVEALHAENIGVQIHYIPVYQQPYYKKLYGNDIAKTCPNAEQFYNAVISLPMFAAMTDDDVADVIEAVCKVNSAI